MTSRFRLSLKHRRKSSSSIQKEPSQPDPSCVSLKSDQSKHTIINFKDSFAEKRFSNKSTLKHSDDQNVSHSSFKKHKNAVFKKLERKVVFLVKNELKRFKKVLSPDYPEFSGREEKDDEGQGGVCDAVLKITLHILRKMDQTEFANMLQTKLTPMSQQILKSNLRVKFHRVHEGFSLQGKTTLLHEIYTELYITGVGSREVINQHEMRPIETTSWTTETQEAPIKCNDIFQASPGKDKPIRTVLTKGVAGIGKTIAVQKFILDWTEGKDNQDIHFIFPLPFRELNLLKERIINLMELLHQFFPKMSLQNFDDYKIMFIFDGLDECRLPLDFQNNTILCDVTESASLDVLLTNLIKGNLLPSALLWITSRPAAANQIPLDCVDQVTEVRGFNDSQKDEYFRKRINDPSLANRIITHIKSSRSLYIMCHIPVFCWISATVLERMLSEAESAEIPKTLTQMFTHFLIFQIKQGSQKYQENTDLQKTTEDILSLGKLAFHQLEKGNLIFYEEDLRECGIDVKDTSVYSGVCTQIFREEFGLYLGKVYSFVHLSFQEFLAALFKFLSFILKPSKQFKLFSTTMTDLLKREVDRALQSENGHLDLYLRFLLGLSLESNQHLLQGLLTHTGNVCVINKPKIIKYLKDKIMDNPSPEKSINLFHCLNELNDDSLVQEVQKYVKGTGPSGLSGVKLSPAQWSALGFVLLNSEEDLDEFKLSKYSQSEECLLRLLPVIKASRKADLCDSNLTEKSCLALASALISNSSSLTALDMSNNNLQDSGVALLTAGLKNQHCKLETLQLSNCCITEDGCATLASGLRSNLSQLRNLNLSNNKLNDSGVKLLSHILQDPQCKLAKLYLSNCSIRVEGCAAVASSLKSNPSHLRELNLSMNKLEYLGVKILSYLLEDRNFKLEKLHLSKCGIRGEECVLLASALRSNPSHLKKLDLSESEPGSEGINLLSDLLKDSHCKLSTLELSNCSIGEEGSTALFSALRSNPSYLKKLDLSYNKLKDSGVKLLSDLLEYPQCKLEKLKLCDCSIGEEGCSALSSALRSNSSHLKEIDLSLNKLQDSGMKLISNLLEDPLCNLEKLILCDCRIGEDCCAAVASALRSNPSHLRELNLSLNSLGNCKLLYELLEDANCRLQSLIL